MRTHRLLQQARILEQKAVSKEEEMNTKHHRTKQDDCLDCVSYREKCNGTNFFKERISGRGVVRCANQVKSMTPDEVEAFIAASTRK